MTLTVRLVGMAWPGVAIITINSTKNHETTYRFSCKITKPYKVFHVTEEGWERRGGTGEGICQNIIL